MYVCICSDVKRSTIWGYDGSISETKVYEIYLKLTIERLNKAHYFLKENFLKILMRDALFWAEI